MRYMKTRLDLILVNRNLVSGRDRAKALIMEGVVFVNGEKEDKPGLMIDEDKIKTLEIRSETIPFVSRGGLKLAKAVSLWNLDFTGLVCLDIGASTGGFTDCMLQNGARKVYSVDVGYGQLDYGLRSDKRVCCMEKTNFRYSKPEDFDEQISFAGADVSFISLDKILKPAHSILDVGATMVVLIKPQFEAGRDKVGKNGVVRDKNVHIEVINKVFDYAREAYFDILGLDFSPIRGPKGNIEYLLYLLNTDNSQMSNPAGEQTIFQFDETADTQLHLSGLASNQMINIQRNKVRGHCQIDEIVELAHTHFGV